MPFQDKKVNFAVVGMGHIGKRHADMIARNRECELVAILDVLPQETLQLPPLLQQIPFYSSLNSYLATDPDVDVITIATPNGYHAEQALLCLEARKHIVIEKPMTLSRQDAEKVIFKALHVLKHVFTVMQNRYSPPSVWIKNLIDRGTLGKIYMVQLNCYWNRDERYYTKDSWHGSQALDGGTLFTQFSHFIDMMYWLFGDIENIQAKFSDFAHQHLTEFEDSGFVCFDFVNGGMGCLNYSTAIWNQNMESSMTIIAENGSVKIGGQYMDQVAYCHIKDYTPPALVPTNPGNDYGSYKGSAQNHHYVIENVVDTLKGRNTIATNALEGLKVVEIIERIYGIRPTKYNFPVV
ncbi:Gfo/Idh/MocA family oxidoreductase [Pontibacter qinzhouensis]|uniref:Gfo/Idh/MocA family oxidoreductase n=1 Tax=Pontibacter qinzhouensis TaxID=2603253 RepID=A0A5C8ILM2_9BACT|nr:Gfo/Idh/MocA family oxidoreductase [Pontibacter qinzhouensis]TXK22418.1 Gfo/Idh/MocA family oxidoreductase [Pontibacter qinzhouensis]